MKEQDKQEYPGLLRKRLIQSKSFRQRHLGKVASAWIPECSPKEIDLIRKCLTDDAVSNLDKATIFVALTKEKPPTINETIFLRDLMKTLPYTQTLQLAVAMAEDQFGADLLLASVKLGHIPARLLQEKAVLDRLKVSKLRDLDARVAELTKDLPPVEKRLETLIKTRTAGFAKFKSDPNLGKEVFKKQCAICHQLNNEGAKVGPQLDGVGIRGVERLLEDTLDPSRNVDVDFRATELKLLDGRNVSGLVRKDGGVYILTDAQGKEQRIAEKDVDKATVSKLSAMPANVDAIIKEDEYYHLLAFLLQQKPK